MARNPPPRYSGTPGFPGLGTGASGQVGNRSVSPVGGVPVNPDPYNWRGIAAELKAEEDRKRAAQRRLNNPTAPRPVGNASAPAAVPETPPPTIKELLDAYRAMNNGALPPGTSAEMAAMIDKGIWTDWSMLEGNPALAQALLSIQGAITGLPQQYQDAKNEINQNYQSLTGGVMTAGQSYMNGITPLLTTPDNPNAALIMQDPALSGYQNTLTNIGATAGLNQATDLSWFDKMLQNQISNYEFMMRSAALPQPVEEEKGGGGGGGGGGGRGYGGGGGGGDWSDPKTTVTNTDLVQTNEADVLKGYNLNFIQDLMAGASTPEEAAFYQSMFNKYRAQPINVAAGLETEIEATNAKIQELAAQQVARQGYLQTVPASIESNEEKRRANLGNFVLMDDPNDQTDKPRWMQDPDVDPQVQTAEQAAFNKHAEEMDKLLAARYFGNVMNQLRDKGINFFNNRFDEQEAITALGNKQKEWDKQQYLRARQEFDKNNEAGVEWNWNDWGGYVRPVDRKGLSDLEQREEWLRNMAAITAENNPNILPQWVSTTTTDSATQKSQGQTTQRTYDPLSSIGPNLQDQPTGYPDEYFMPGFTTPAEDLIEGGTYAEDLDPMGVAGEARGLPRSASRTTALLRAAAQERMHPRQTKAAIEHRERVRPTPPKKSKAAIEHQERTTRPNKAAIEHKERVIPSRLVRPNARTISVMGKALSSVPKTPVPKTPKTPKPKTPKKVRPKSHGLVY